MTSLSKYLPLAKDLSLSFYFGSKFENVYLSKIDVEENHALGKVEAIDLNIYFA